MLVRGTQTETGTGEEKTEEKKEEKKPRSQPNEALLEGPGKAGVLVALCPCSSSCSPLLAFQILVLLALDAGASQMQMPIQMQSM